MPSFDEVLIGLGKISEWVKTWGGPLAAIGSVSMALIQVAKNTLPWRSDFQRKTLQAWLARRNEKSSKEAEADLIRLTTAGDDDAFYDSDIEDICSRIKSTIAVVLDYPYFHQPLLRCLASQASEDDIESILHPPPPDAFQIQVKDANDKEKESIRNYASAKTRIGLEVRSAIDAIQVHISFRWKRRLQRLSVILSSILGIVALLVAKPTRYSIGAMLIVGLLAGFLAPVARDLVAAVEKWRS
jgi:hypothetical protein